MKVLASGTFWAIALFVVAVIKALVIWRQGYRRRLIVCGTPVITSLISSTPRLVAGTIKVLFNDEPLHDPYMIELAIDSRSRRDIGSKDFDRDRPLVIHLGATIVGATPLSGQEYLTHIEMGSNAIRLGPCKIRRGHIATIQLITDGKPKIQCEGSDNPILDVDVRVGNGDRPRQPPPKPRSHPRHLVPPTPAPGRRTAA